MGRKRPIITEELVEFEKQPVEAQEFSIIQYTDHFRGIYMEYISKGKPKDHKM
jgi:hypothetical protein